MNVQIVGWCSAKLRHVRRHPRCGKATAEAAVSDCFTPTFAKHLLRQHLICKTRTSSVMPFAWNLALTSIAIS